MADLEHIGPSIDRVLAGARRRAAEILIVAIDAHEYLQEGDEAVAEDLLHTVEQRLRDLIAWDGSG